MEKVKTRRYKKRQVQKYIPRGLGSELKVKVEFYNVIGYGAGVAAYTFSATSNASLSIIQMLNVSPSYTTYAALFGRYKITGISVRVSRVVTDTEIATNMSGGLPPAIVAFYPGQAGGTINGSSALYNDNKIHVDSLVNVPQSRYWKLSKGFISGDQNGLGIWNATDAVNQQIGNFSVFAAFTSTATASMNVFECVHTLYVTFGNPIA